MRKLTFVCVALAGLSVAQSASAITQVWFEAAGSNPASSVVTQGLPGNTLALSCNAAAPGTRCEWLVTVMANTPVTDAGILAWAQDFGSPNAPKLRIKSLNVNTANWTLGVSNGQPGPAGGGPDNLWIGAQGQRGTPGADGTYQLATFVLSKIKPTVPQTPQTWAVFTNVGGNEWGCDIGDATGGAACDANSSYPIVQFGANAPISAEGGGAPQLPVIVGVNIPEPATLSLIGLGLLGLLRRRR